MQRKAISLIFLTFFSTPVWADTLSAGYAIGSMSVLSASYKAQSESTSALDLRYTHPLFGKWSASGAYMANSSSSFSGYGIGVNYDSEAPRSTYGNIQNNGAREVSTIPQWVVRGSALAGRWRFLDSMEKAAPRIGEKRIATVEAQLYGVALGIGVHRFFNEHFSASIDLNNIYSAGANFSVNATLLGLALHYHY